MQLENEAHDLERIAKAFRLISKEISYGGLTNALPGVAIENSGAVRGTVLLSEATAPTRSATERTDMDALSPSNSCAPPARDPAAALGHPSSPATAAPGSSSGSAPLSREKTVLPSNNFGRVASSLPAGGVPVADATPTSPGSSQSPVSLSRRFCICGKDVSHKAGRAKTCSTRCRVQKHRLVPLPKPIMKEPALMRYAYVNLGDRYAVMRGQDGAAWTALYTVQSEAEAARFVRVCMRADEVGALSRQRLERGMAVAV
jgi:hypothetical protein